MAGDRPAVRIRMLPNWPRVFGVLGIGIATILAFALAGSLPLLRAKPAQALREL